MYKVNQRLMKFVRICFLFGMPLLVSFVFSHMANYRLLCVGLLLIAFYLNGIYPDRIGLIDEKLQLKLFLKNDWLIYSLDEVDFVQGKRFIYVVIKGKKKYRITMEKLSVRLYEELKEMSLKKEE